VDHHRRCSWQRLYGYQIKTVFIVGPAEAQRPKTGRAGNVSLLSLGDSVEPCAAGSGASGLDLNEGDSFASANDQIDIMPPPPEAMRLDPPPARCKECHGDTLAFESQDLTTVFPVFSRNESAGCFHGSTYRTWSSRKNQLAAAWGWKLRQADKSHDEPYGTVSMNVSPLALQWLPHSVSAILKTGLLRPEERQPGPDGVFHSVKRVDLLISTRS